MLVLSRKLNESIIVDVPPSNQTTRIVIMACKLEPHQVRLGIEAPRSTTVAREELLKPTDAPRRPLPSPAPRGNAAPIRGRFDKPHSR